MGSIDAALHVFRGGKGRAANLRTRTSEALKNAYSAVDLRATKDEEGTAVQSARVQTLGPVPLRQHRRVSPLLALTATIAFLFPALAFANEDKEVLHPSLACEAAAKRLGYTLQGEHLSAPSVFGELETTWWRLDANGARRVGLVLESFKGEIEDSAYFLVPSGAPEPGREEQAALLACEGFTAFDESDSRDALAGLHPWPEAKWRTSEVSTTRDDEHFVIASQAERLGSRLVTRQTQRTSWRPDRTPTLEKHEEGKAVCPCYSRFHGQWFGPDDINHQCAAPPRPWTRWTASLRLVGHWALGINEGPRQVRWLRVGSGCVQVLGKHEGRWWFQNTTSMGEVSLGVYDPRHDTAFDLVITDLSFDRVRVTAEGLELSDEAGHRSVGVAPWPVLNQALDSPNTAVSFLLSSE